MKYDGRRKPIYYGVAGSLFLFTLFPTFVTLIFWSAFSRWSRLSDEKVLFVSLAFGCLVAFLFELCCVLDGLLQGSLKVVFARMIEFFSNLSISFKFAVKSYFNNIKEEGMVFWIYFDTILLTSGISIFSFLKYFEII